MSILSPRREQVDTVNESSQVEAEHAPSRPRREEGELDMTPMVDVTFLLLIFFMVTASFSLQKSIRVPNQDSDLPSPNTPVEPLDTLVPVTVNVDENGGFLVLAADWEREASGKQKLITVLKQAIGANQDGMRLDIKVHENSQLQMLVDAMDSGVIAGLHDIHVTEVVSFD